MSTSFVDTQSRLKATTLCHCSTVINHLGDSKQPIENTGSGHLRLFGSSVSLLRWLFLSSGYNCNATATGRLLCFEWESRGSRAVAVVSQV